MYAKGMTTRQISETLEDIYGFEASEGFISDVTDKILPQIEDQNKTLQNIIVKYKINKVVLFLCLYVLLTGNKGITLS